MAAKHKVKITILRREVYPDLQKEYLAQIISMSIICYVDITLLIRISFLFHPHQGP